MAVELALALEARLGLQAPLGESAGAFTVTTLAQRILSTEAGQNREILVSEDLAARHLGEDERQGVAELIGRFEESQARGRNAAPASDAAESSRRLLYDITRLVTRIFARTPNGIDRVDHAFATHALSSAADAAAP